jgi:hypothetical protein
MILMKIFINSILICIVLVSFGFALPWVVSTTLLPALLNIAMALALVVICLALGMVAALSMVIMVRKKNEQ